MSAGIPPGHEIDLNQTNKPEFKLQGSDYIYYRYENPKGIEDPLSLISFEDDDSCCRCITF